MHAFLVDFVLLGLAIVLAPVVFSFVWSIIGPIIKFLFWAFVVAVAASAIVTFVQALWEYPLQAEIMAGMIVLAAALMWVENWILERLFYRKRFRTPVKPEIVAAMLSSSKLDPEHERIRAFVKTLNFKAPARIGPPDHPQQTST